jgi:hypothetical protein
MRVAHIECANDVCVGVPAGCIVFCKKVTVRGLRDWCARKVVHVFRLCATIWEMCSSNMREVCLVCVRGALLVCGPSFKVCAVGVLWAFAGCAIGLQEFAERRGMCVWVVCQFYGSGLREISERNESGVRGVFLDCTWVVGYQVCVLCVPRVCQWWFIFYDGDKKEKSYFGEGSNNSWEMLI